MVRSSIFGTKLQSGGAGLYSPVFLNGLRKSPQSGLDRTVASLISEFITAVDTGINKLKEYYSKTGGPVETQYALAAMLDPSQKLDIFAGPGWGHSFSRKHTKEFVDH